jgi:t-SNARE complex subunit (syntaxin)
MTVPATQHNTSQHQLVTDPTLNRTVAVIRKGRVYRVICMWYICIVAVWYAEG